MVEEGQDIIFTVTPSAVTPEAITFYIQLTGASVGAITAQASADDFSAVLLPVTIPAGSSTPVTVTATVSTDAATEGPEGFQAKLLDSTFIPVSNTDAITGTITEGVSAGRTFTLTAGVDSGTPFTGGAGDDIYNALDVQNNVGNYVASFTALDALDGGAGNNTLNVVTAAAHTIPATATVKNIQTANITTGSTLQGDVSGWTGLTKLVASQAGGSNASALTAAATTDVTLTDSTAAAATTSVQGGKNVNVTLNGVTAGGTLNVGTTSEVTGTVDVTTNMLATQTGANTADAINVKGGTTVNVMANLNEKAGAGNTVTGGAIGVTGTTATTTVTVKQSAAATAANEVLAATGVVAKTAVTAAPGQNGVAAVTAVAEATAKAAVAGVVDGAVTITDAASGTGLGTIKTVTLENYGASSSVVSNALTDLTLTGTAGTLTVTRVSGLGASDTLNLNLNGLSGTNTITDTNNEIKTLNVTTGGTVTSTLAAFADTGLTTLNVAGTQTLALSAINNSLTKLAISGAAGFTGDVSARGAALDFTTTSSGTITATLDAATQKFTGSTGQTDITINADAKVAIVGGSGSNDKLVLNNTAATFNTAGNVADGKGLTKMVSGFEVLGTSTASQGTFDISSLPTGIKGVSMDGTAAGIISFTKAAPSTTLAINAAQTSAVTLQAADANGVANTVNLTLGSSSNKTGFTVADLTLKDANDVGAGTLNVTTNASTWLQKQTITKLTDNGLSNLNVSGNAGLTITDLTQSTTQATAFTINNTLAGADDVVEITTLSNANLGTLTFAGNGNSTVGTLDGLSGKVLTLANTGTGTASVGGLGVSAATESSTVTFSTLNAGESITLGGRSVTADGSAANYKASYTAAEVATVFAGGSVTGLTAGGALNGWTVTTTGVASGQAKFTSTTSGSSVPDLSLGYDETGLAAPTAVNAGTKADGDGGPESTAWIMQGLALGQSFTLAGLTVTAQKTLTAIEVADAFTAGTTSAGSYTISGALAAPTGWTNSATFKFTDNDAGVLTLTNGANGDVADFTTAPTANTVSDPTNPTYSTIQGGTVSSAQSLTTITFNGNVALGANDNTAPATAIGATTGITVDGASNNAHVNITLNAAAAGATNTIKLGNANNYITDNTTAGKVVIEVGTGGNMIDIDQGAANTYLATVTLGAHTNTATVFNKIFVSDADGQATGYSTAITGAAKGDVIVFNNANNITWDAVTAGEQANITGASNLASAITLAFGTLGTAHSATSFTYGGDTYVIQNEGADTTFATGTDSIIKLTGLVTVADNGASNGEVVIA